MKKFLIAFALCSVLASSAVFAETKVKYISPNSDGIQDELIIPLKIQEKRYVESWALVIMDKSQNVIRTIGNKQALPEKVGFKSFFKQLVTPKVGVQIPSEVIWNGALESGETAPDGTYYYYFTAKDDNGNEGKTSVYTVVIDTVAPDVNVNQPGDKIFGEGAKSAFKVSQSGSVEDEWIGTFKTVDGTVVKTVKWVNAEPAAFSWHGTDDEGAQVYDGVYSYEITATDRAGNKAPYTAITNIIYSAEKPATNIFIDGSRYFSTVPGSKNQVVNLDVSIPVPDAKTGNELTDWAVTICDAKGNPVRVFNKSKDGNPPAKIVFDGKNDSGANLPDGSYQAKVTASYKNGYVPPVITSPLMVLDTEKPEAKFTMKDKVFGSANKRSIDIALSVPQNTGAPVPEWTAKILTADGKTTVKTFNLGEFPAEKVSWNGIGDDGKLAEKGEYVLKIFAEDMAGNSSGENVSEIFTFDTTEAQLLLAANDTAFSPNGDAVKDVITFAPVSQGSDVVDYTFSVTNKAGKEVYSPGKKSEKLPSSISWNGKTNDGILCEDGVYIAKLSVTTANGSTPAAVTEPFLLDTVAPVFEAEIPWTDFSPDGDGSQDVIPVTVKNCSQEDLWTCEIRDSKNKTVNKFTWNGKIPKFEWNGTNASGNTAPDGKYTMVFLSTDAAGNSLKPTSISDIVLDARETKAYVTTEFEGISPNGDGVFDAQKFEIRTTVSENILSWKFSICKENGEAVRSWSEKDSADLPATILWDGYGNSDTVCDGTFSGALEITYKKGNRVSSISSPFICTALPPQLKVQTAPEYFSPDNDGTADDLFIKLSGTTKAKIKNWSFTIKDPKGRDFYKTAGKNQITERIIWDGLSNVQKNKAGKAESVQSAMDYPYEFIVTDNLGMTSKKEGIIPIDVLVIRDGNVLKMAVPSIIFLSDASEFQKPQKNLTQEQVAKNIQVLNRIAEILKKFPDYKVTIVGHANRLTNNPEEETTDNMREWGRASTPLSKERSEAIKAYLIKRGVAAANLSTDGKGGTEPIVDPNDKDNNWKNRRVEFILEK